MNVEDSLHREKPKSKYSVPIRIIPSNYAKSHRLNADLSFRTLNNSTDTVSADDALASHSMHTGDTSVVKLIDTHEDECLANDKRSTPRKISQYHKFKESDGTSPDNSQLKGGNNEEEPKPRIVLTFRSEKPGLRSSNMKIVSPDEKSHSREANTRRSARFRTVADKMPTGRNDGSDDRRSANSSPHKNISTHSESDEAADATSPPPLKRSNPRRSKDFSETVLGNAIARKEKSYNDTTPTQRLITRPVKPTAKVLANRELKLSVETTNSARLHSEVSPEDGQPRRSSRRRAPRARCVRDSSNSPQKELKQTMRETQKNIEDSDDEILKPRVDYLRVDVIKKSILGSSACEGRVSVSIDKSVSHDRENRRFNKLKKKHLSMLGLQAVCGVKQEICSSNGNVTDDSTMDSTNTDAVVEHLNAQRKELKAEKELALQELEDEVIDKELDIDQGDVDQDEEDEELVSLLKEGEEGPEVHKGTDSETSDEEFAYSTRARPDVSAATPRVTRKAARLLQPHDTRSNHSEGERAECSSPAAGEEGLPAAAPGEGSHCVSACLCTSVSNVYVAPDALTEPVFCRAVESVSGARVGCSHAAVRGVDGSHAALRRPSIRVPYFLLCRLHLAQLRKHLCCPLCGVFCTQGTFYQCSEGHVFHLECGVLMGGSGEGDEAPGCLHCGEDPQEGVLLNRACVKVHIDMVCSNKQLFLPNQRLQSTPALMGFTQESPDEQECPVPASLLPPAPVSLTSLRQRGEASADYEELLTSSAEQRLVHAVTTVHDAEHVLTKLISGVDLHQPLETAEGGTYLHLAARHGNLTAVYLLHYGGCRLDTTDAQLRTPLMAAVLALNCNKTDKQATSPKNNDSSSHYEEQGDSNENEVKTRESLKQSRELLQKNILQVMKYLVAAGCDVNFQSTEGVTALHLAAQHGLAGASSVLLGSHRTRVDVRDHGGWTPLVWAAENKHPHIVRLLVKHGADANTCDAEGNSVLHWCVLAGCVASLQLLLDKVPRHAVDTINPHGDTPLHVAARQDHYPCVVILLARGGRTDMKNSSGELAVDCARGETRTAISLNMQMSLMARDRPPRHKLLSSDISRGREELGVSCVNELDDAALPDDFTYITRHVTPQYIRLHNTLASLQGCECSGETCGSGGPAAGAGCACCALGVRRWYADGRLVHDFPFRDAPMIFECNETCKCNLMQCPNAVVTRLSRRGAVFVRAQVFRCREPRGWGLRTLAAVPRGAPVALYCGELLEASVADTRAKDQYMFAMEVKQHLLDQQSECEALCVDAGQYGSATRFVNHSCRANLSPVRVFTRSRDVRAPDVVLFATRNIAPLEELTFNYGDKFWSVKSKIMRCCCGAANCRYPSTSLATD